MLQLQKIILLIIFLVHCIIFLSFACHLRRLLLLQVFKSRKTTMKKCAHHYHHDCQCGIIVINRLVSYLMCCFSGMVCVCIVYGLAWFDLRVEWKYSLWPSFFFPPKTMYDDSLLKSSNFLFRCFPAPFILLWLLTRLSHFSFKMAWTMAR